MLRLGARTTDMPSATNEFPMPANARPPEPPQATDTAARVANHHRAIATSLAPFTGQETFILDPDLRLALEDMCQAAEGRGWRERWPEWLSRMVNDSLKNYLGQ